MFISESRGRCRANSKANETEEMLKVSLGSIATTALTIVTTATIVTTVIIVTTATSVTTATIVTTVTTYVM